MFSCRDLFKLKCLSSRFQPVLLVFFRTLSVKKKIIVSDMHSLPPQKKKKEAVQNIDLIDRKNPEEDK